MLENKKEYIATALQYGCWLVLLMTFMCLPSLVIAGSDKPIGFGRFNIEKSAKPWAYSRVTLPNGTKVERFELRSGDCSGSDCRTDRERVEKIQGKGAALGKDIWVAWSVYLPANFPRQGRKMYSKVGQWHLPKFQGMGQGPNLLFEVSDQCLKLTAKDSRVADTDPMRPAPNIFSKCIVARKAILGHWTRYMVNAKWSTGPDGYIKVFVNGVQKWAYKGQTVNVAVRPYFRYGIYRSFVSRCGGPCPTQIVYYKDVRQGKSRKQVE